jgi:putative DNA primase/helicase
MAFRRRSNGRFLTHNWRLNCLNGTIDLRTGTIRAHRREDLLTKRCPVAYDADATCPQWLAFLHDVTAGNQALIDYLRRAVGYSLTGSVEEQCVFFLYGPGQNGKSTFLSTIRAMMSSYGMQAMPELLMARAHEQHPTERADLFRTRFVATVEVEQGKCLAESLVKQLTGGRQDPGAVSEARCRITTDRAGTSAIGAHAATACPLATGDRPCGNLSPMIGG